MVSRPVTLPASRSFDFGLRPEIKHLIILILAAAATLVPTLFWGIPSNQDLSNHFRFELPFYDALRAGNLYPGWLSESNHGFGDASFRFYPPALYYVLAIAKATAGSWYAATVITFTALSILGALGVYLWAREFGSSQMAKCWRESCIQLRLIGSINFSGFAIGGICRRRRPALRLCVHRESWPAWGQKEHRRTRRKLRAPYPHPPSACGSRFDHSWRLCAAVHRKGQTRAQVGMSRPFSRSRSRGERRLLDDDAG